MSKWVKFTLASTVGLVLFSVWARSDYNDWVALGPGGLPHSFQGWAQVTFFRMLKSDPLDAGAFQADVGSDSDVATLEEIPLRVGERPQVARHPVPHRQLDQHGGQPFAMG